MDTLSNRDSLTVFDLALLDLLKNLRPGLCMARFVLLRTVLSQTDNLAEASARVSDSTISTLVAAPPAICACW